MERGSPIMPLTPYQTEIALLLSANRTPDSHLAGGAALHLSPNSLRYSNDLDYFHDSVERVASAFAQDDELLKRNGHAAAVEMKQPGYIRAIVSKDSQSTKVEWSHDSAWRFMPVIANELCGYQLHPIDLAVNKVLALAGRDEPRDFLDVLYIHREILSLGALCWAASGKDPGFTPLSLLELLKRRGKYRPDDFARLRLTENVDLHVLKTSWLEAIASAESWIKERPLSEAGCLYYAAKSKTFISARTGDDYVVHYGRPGGIIPKIVETP